MKAIVCVSNNWGIGRNNKLLFDIKDDLRHFKKLTTGKVCVMGYNTLLSLPNSKPLRDRTNIVLSKKVKDIEGAIVCKDLHEVFEELKNYNDDDIYVIGGASIYKQILPFCKEVIVTMVNENVKADVFFENLNKLKEWKRQSIEPLSAENQNIYVVTYSQKSPLKYSESSRGDLQNTVSNCVEENDAELQR